jgi:hypothetical protein
MANTSLLQMRKVDKMELEEQFTKSFLKGYLSMGMHDFFPFNPARIDPFFADIFLERVYGLTKRAKVRTEEELRGCFNPFLIRSELVYLMLAANMTKFENEKKKGLFRFFVDTLKGQVEGDLFCNEGRNILVGEQVPELDEVEDKRLTGMLITNLNALTWSLYTDVAPSTGFEISGPYKNKEGIVVVRDFFNLNPRDLSDLGGDINSVKIITLYKEIPLEIDFYGHIYSKENLLENLIKQKIFVNSKEIKENGMVGVLEKTDSLMKKQRERITRMDFEKLKEFYVKLRFYRYKKLFDLVGEDWQPPQEFFERVKNKELLPEIPKEKTTKEMLINLINPA